MSPLENKSVVTRFAPSPTGYLHIGGARTALFNWLFAKANGGTMLLRIEDTDRERSSEAAVEALVDGLSWLGLNWDGKPISQYANAQRHKEIAEQMVRDGTAYHCYATPEELSEMREKARRENRPALYDRRWRNRPVSDAPDGIKPAIRLKAPLEGETVVDDRVQGRVVFPNKDLDDLVLLRSDGNPTYMLAVVVDDHDMGVTHIIRGDDHLTNAARQSLIYRALDWEIPVMAHIPLIHGPDGAKFSKRHGALGAEAYRGMGYLPEAMRNYLVRLGWSHGDDEIMSMENLLEWFGFEGMGKAPSRFDFAKLENVNGHYIRNSDDKHLVELLFETAPHFETGNTLVEALNEADMKQLLSAMPLLKERAKTLIELADGAGFVLNKRPLCVDEKACGILTNGGAEILALIKQDLGELLEWNSGSINDVINQFGEKSNLKFGKIAQPLRAALTGTTVSPSVSEVMAILGKDECLLRLSDQASTA